MLEKTKKQSRKPLLAGKVKEYIQALATTWPTSAGSARPPKAKIFSDNVSSAAHAQGSCNHPRISSRILQNSAALKFITLGFDFSNKEFLDTVAMLRTTMHAASECLQYQPTPRSDDEAMSKLHSALEESVNDALRDAQTDRVGLGITGGMDSRLLFAIIRSILPPENIFTYTFGYPGQYDFEFIKRYGTKFLTNHRSADTRSISWCLDHRIEKLRKAGYPRCYSGKEMLYPKLMEKGVPKFKVHGFMGDALIARSKPNKHIPIKNWDDAVGRFIKKNDRFKLQFVVQPYFKIDRLLPPRPDEKIPGLDDYDLLDFGLRQYQRIVNQSRKSKTLITPYTNPKWLNAVISVNDPQERERIYFKYLITYHPAVFFELSEQGIKNHTQHARFRQKLTAQAAEEIKAAGLKNPNGSAFCTQCTARNGAHLSGRQFCEYAEYNNNPSFKNLVDELFDGMLTANLLDKDFLSSVLSEFHRGKLTAAEQLRGIVNLELNRRAGTLDF